MSKIQFSYYKVEDLIKDDFFNGIEKNKFSFSLNINEHKDIKGNSLFIVNLDNEFYLSNSSNKQKVTSIENRIVLKNFRKLKISSVQEITPYLSKRTANTFLKKISYEISAFSDRLNKEIYKYFCDFHNEEIKEILKNERVFKKNISFMQNDAIYFALSIAKMETPQLKSIEVANNSETELINLSEDNVIFFDVNNDIQGLDRETHITGKAVFKSDSEELIIYTANKNPLEHLLGVDLIYINNIQKNMVMVQYKMLEKEGEKWRFRDRNNQLAAEIERMNRVSNILNTHSENEYRLNPNPFFLRFIKRQAFGNNSISFCISLDHYKKIITQAITLGSNGGRRVDYEEMNKHYIGKSELESLIRSGYIGTYARDTGNLGEIINLISNGDQNNGLVIAFKNKLPDITQAITVE